MRRNSHANQPISKDKQHTLWTHKLPNCCCIITNSLRPRLSEFQSSRGRKNKATNPLHRQTTKKNKLKVFARSPWLWRTLTSQIFALLLLKTLLKRNHKTHFNRRCYSENTCAFAQVQCNLLLCELHNSRTFWSKASYVGESTRHGDLAFSHLDVVSDQSSRVSI